MEQTKRTRNWRDLCLCTAFFAFLCAPAVALALRRENIEVNLAENRRAAELPAPPKSALDWAAWPRAFEAWHDDHFGLRETLVRAHNFLMIFGLGTSPSPSIAVGHEHWIFTPIENIDLWRGANPFSVRELEAWRDCLESRQRELAKRGIKYYFVLAPDKAEIYPEFLPPKYRQGGPSRTDQLAAYLAKHSSFQILDLRAALLEEKRNDVADDYAYYPLGTHWNERGVRAGMKAIVAALALDRPEVAAVDDGIENRVLIGSSGDSWAGRLYLADLLEQSVRRSSFRDAKLRTLRIGTSTTAGQASRVIVDQDDSSLPRAVVLHDSFGEPMHTTLSRHFSHSVFVWEPMIDVALLDQEKPDLLIHILSDRVLARLQPQAFSSASDERVCAQFEASREIALRLDPASNSPRIKAYHDASVALRTEGMKARVACEMKSAADAFLLPEFKLHRGVHAVVRLEFESPISGTSSVLFQTRSNPAYSRRRQLQYEIRQGLNVLYIELLEPELGGPLLFRPAGEPGTFLVSGLEVRLVAD